MNLETIKNDWHEIYARGFSNSYYRNATQGYVTRVIKAGIHADIYTGTGTYGTWLGISTTDETNPYINGVQRGDHIIVRGGIYTVTTIHSLGGYIYIKKIDGIIPDFSDWGADDYIVISMKARNECYAAYGIQGSIVLNPADLPAELLSTGKMFGKMALSKIDGKTYQYIGEPNAQGGSLNTFKYNYSFMTYHGTSSGINKALLGKDGKSIILSNSYNDSVVGAADAEDIYYYNLRENGNSIAVHPNTATTGGAYILSFISTVNQVTNFEYVAGNSSVTSADNIFKSYEYGRTYISHRFPSNSFPIRAANGDDGSYMLSINKKDYAAEHYIPNSSYKLYYNSDSTGAIAGYTSLPYTYKLVSNGGFLFMSIHYNHVLGTGVDIDTDAGEFYFNSAPNSQFKEAGDITTDKMGSILIELPYYAKNKSQ